jgi:hypothetical protein
MTKDETMMSLYDYRGHKDRNGEGQRIYAKAKEQGVAVGARDVEHEKYKGKVMMYPKWFLDEYFNTKTTNTDHDDLPF